MITLHLYSDRDGNAVANIDSPDGRRALTDGEKADALTLLMLATAHTPNRHPREVAERRITSNLTSLMRTKLAQRRHHGSWDRDVWAAMNGVMEEVEELRSAVRDYDVSMCDITRAEVISEAADVANFCAMLIDVVSRDGEQ